MRVVLISTPDERPSEVATVETLFSAGLDRYHLRKPAWKSAQIALWLESLPARWRGRIVLHSHTDLAPCFHVGGIHFSGDGDAPSDPARRVPPGCLTSRSCHDVAAVKAALGHYDSVFFSPVFASISKPGYGPAPVQVLDELRAVLTARGPMEKHTDVFALGGVTAQGLRYCQALGFDGVAILGAVWNAADPVAAFLQFQSASQRQADATSNDEGSPP
jgi:thiamine-phosphate pyrophosphorylase